MKLECKRNRLKERGKQSNFLDLLNARNIQHFIYDTDTGKLNYTNLGVSKEIYILVTANDITDICTVINKYGKQDMTFEQWLIEKAGFSTRKQAELHVQYITQRKEILQKKITELTKQLESYGV